MNATDKADTEQTNAKGYDWAALAGRLIAFAFFRWLLTKVPPTAGLSDFANTLVAVLLTWIAIYVDPKLRARLDKFELDRHKRMESAMADWEEKAIARAGPVAERVGGAAAGIVVSLIPGWSIRTTDDWTTWVACLIRFAFFSWLLERLPFTASLDEVPNALAATVLMWLVYIGDAKLRARNNANQELRLLVQRQRLLELLITEKNCLEKSQYESTRLHQ